MTCNSLKVLGDIVRSGLWSKQDSVERFRTIIIDVESILEYLYKRLAQRHTSHAARISKKPDLYATTLVNYIEFTQDLKRLFDYFAHQRTEVRLVYRGDFMEAPLFDLLAAEFTKNTQRVVESIGALVEYHKRGHFNLSLDHFLRPNLLLIAFKSYVNERRASGGSIRVHQAYYNSYPLIAKLARDLNCPVLTNNGDFIIMDVRAGFILMDQFWNRHFDNPKPVTPGGNKSSTSGGHNSKSTFHYNALFLKQHPGLSASMAINMFPLTTVDFLTKYTDSLENLKIFTTKYSESDFLKAPGVDRKIIYKRYQSAANRLERVLTFLCSKSPETFGYMIRSEAVRVNSRFDEDYRQLFNYNAVAYEFKSRSRLILRHMDDYKMLLYMENVLTNRECTAHFLMSLVCCSLGRLETINYNLFMQFEDLATIHSAFSMMNYLKSMLMSLFSAKSRSKHAKQTVTKGKSNSSTNFKNTPLTLIDRKLNEVKLRTIESSSDNDKLVEQLHFSKLIKENVNKESRIQFINQAFKSKDLLSFPVKSRHSFEKDIKNQLSLVLSLFDYSFKTASIGDDYFHKKYTKLYNPFQDAILDHFVYYYLKKGKDKEILSMVQRVEKHNATSVSSIGSLASEQVRHLIELLNASMEGYTELNAFLDYPLPKLDLNYHYNPILLFNLAIRRLSPQ